MLSEIVAAKKKNSVFGGTIFALIGAKKKVKHW